MSDNCFNSTTDSLDYFSTGAGFHNLFFGDGSDGDTVILVDSIMTRNMFWNSINITSTDDNIYPSGYSIFCRGEFHCNGTISSNGIDGGSGNSDGTPGNGGHAISGGILFSSLGAGNGGGGFTTGGAPGANSPGINADSNAGGAGATGGDGSPASGGAGGSVGVISLARSRAFEIVPWYINFSSQPGAGGGGGGGNVVDHSGAGGGGGGSGGGRIQIFAYSLTGSGHIEARGGSGGPGGTKAFSDVGDGGGGGGGSGGLIRIAYYDALELSVNVDGGDGGGGPLPGSSGSVGIKSIYNMLQDEWTVT